MRKTIFVFWMTAALVACFLASPVFADVCAHPVDVGWGQVAQGLHPDATPDSLAECVDDQGHATVRSDYQANLCRQWAQEVLVMRDDWAEANAAGIPADDASDADREAWLRQIVLTSAFYAQAEQEKRASCS